MAELKEKIENEEHVTSDDFTQAIINEGIENIWFICPLNPISMVVLQLGFALSDGNKYIDTLCKITEDRYKVSQNYKIGVVPVDNENISPTSYYTSDMLSLIKSGLIKIVVNK